jgi:ribosome recycling factor
MNPALKQYKDAGKDKMVKSCEHLEANLVKIRAGKANPGLLNGISIDYYGAKTPLSQTASINTPDARTIIIQPWDKKMLQEIEKAILAANIGLTPSNTGEVIRLNMPPLTEDRRKELVKIIKHEAETAKISVRNARRETIEELKKQLKNGIPEDEVKDAEREVEKLTETYNKKVDEIFSHKEKEIMTV